MTMQLLSSSNRSSITIGLPAFYETNSKDTMMTLHLKNHNPLNPLYHK